ncbi:MAG: PAS domain-containing protein [Planctomycetota bacterium]
MRPSKPSYPYDQVVRYRRADGGVTWVRCRGLIIRDGSGRPVRMLGAHTDLTELKRREEEAKSREQELRHIIDSLPAYIYYKDGNNKILDLNRAAAEEIGLPREEIVGRQTEEFFPASDAAAFLQDDREVLLSGTPKRGIVENHERIGGERRVIRTDKIPFASADDTLDRLVAVAHDITDLTRGERQFRSFIDNSPALIFAKDLDGRMTLVNEAFRGLFGVPEGDLLGKRDEDFLPPDVAAKKADEFRANDRAVAEERSSQTYEETLRIGEIDRVFASTKFPLVDETGEIYGVGGISTDVTDLRRMELALEEKKRDLERFVYTASHDLKSPLVSIIGFMNYMIEDMEAGDTSQLGDYASRVRAAADRMRRSIDDLLEYSRVGQVPGEPQQLDVGEVAEAVVSELRPRLEGTGVACRVSTGDAAVWLDWTQLAQIITNLVDNAIKYACDGEAPEILITAHEAGQGMVVLCVDDNGPGIAPEYREKAFGLFERLNSGSEGSGVGLAIVRRLAEDAGGRAWIEDDRDDDNRDAKASPGTRVRVMLPAAACGAGSDSRCPSGAEDVR